MPKFLEVTDTAAAREYLGGGCDAVFNVMDYNAVGDGVANDWAALNAALAAAAAAGGGVVFLPAGTYLVTTALNMNTSGVTIAGAGPAATIIKTVSNVQVLRSTGASGLVIRDLQILGDADAGKTLQRGIEWNNVTDGLITNVWAKNLGYDGILLLTGCVDCRVIGNRVSGCQDDGINIGGDPTAASVNNTLTGNVISDCAHTGIHISDRSTFTTATGNTISGCSTGIDTYNSGAYSGGGGNTISGNTIRACTTYGIRIFNSDNNAVTGNSIDGSGIGMRAESASNCTFAGNIVSGAVTFGYRDDSSCSDVSVSGNVFNGSGSAVLLDSPRAQFFGNNLRGVANSVRCGSSGSASVVANNVISNGSGNDIEVQVTGVVVSGNRIDSAGTKCIATSGAGSKCLITGNRVTGAQRGIECATDDNLVVGNFLSGQSVLGIYAAAKARNQIVGNRIDTSVTSINLFGAANTYIADNVTLNSATASISENGTSSGTVLAHNRFDGTVTLSGTSRINIPVTPTTTYTVSNVTTDRTYDANSTSTDELADVLGTLIADLKTKGIIAS